jgi:hypothetical protein
VRLHAVKKARIEQAPGAATGWVVDHGRGGHSFAIYLIAIEIIK